MVLLPYLVIAENKFDEHVPGAERWRAQGLGRVFISWVRVLFVNAMLLILLVTCVALQA